MNRRFLLSVVGVIVVVGVICFAYTNRQNPAGPPKIQITASFYPFAEFARQVGKDKVRVTNITPAGAEPHDFEPSPEDMIKIQQSAIFIYSGAGLEPWADKLVQGLANVKVIKASRGLKLLSAGSNRPDPHFYLDPVMDQKIVKEIASALSEADPANKNYYDRNAAAYIKKLDDLDRKYRAGTLKCRSNDIVTSHDAFAYLAKRYGFTQVAIAGLAVDEPSPAQLAVISNFVKANNIRFIFVEKLVSPLLSETIAREVGAKTLVLDPIEGLTPDEQAAGKDFIGLMEDNLANLKIALGCE